MNVRKHEGYVRVTRPGCDAPLLVSDWVEALTSGRDLLSDHGNWFGVPVFKAVGSWAIGPKGEVHMTQFGTRMPLI